MPPGDYQRPRWQSRCQSKLLSSLARHAGQQITHTDLRQVEQDVLIWGLNPSLGILVLCSQLPKAAGLNTLSFVRGATWSYIPLARVQQPSLKRVAFSVRVAGAGGKLPASTARGSVLLVSGGSSRRRSSRACPGRARISFRVSDISFRK